MSFFTGKEKETHAAIEHVKQDISTPKEEFSPTKESYYGARSRGVSYPVITESFDGEKTPGEIGPYINSQPNFRGLRYRAYDANLKRDLVKIITGKFFKWIIGTGLKMQSEPNELLLKSTGFNAKTFKPQFEALFATYASSKEASYDGMQDVHDLANDAFKTAFLGGDCLVILRVDKNLNMTVQVIDGQYVSSPYDETLLRQVKERGNTLSYGVEKNKKGQHVAYFVYSKESGEILGKHKRVKARNSRTGTIMAWMEYGDKHRIDHVRGIPKITAILEKVNKMDRYAEASVGSAEERAKIVLSVEHDADSDGESPFIQGAKISAGLANNAAAETSGHALGEKTAAAITATTQKQTFNMPIGAKLKALESTTESQFKEFSKAVFSYLCASIDIPPEVAMQVYEQNYSSSRAAINGWDYIVKIYREFFSKSYYKNIQALFLELQVMKGTIKAPGFLEAISAGDYITKNSYLKSKFTGSNLPHIDPLKEVKAVRAMLGKESETDALISREQAVEILGQGDYLSNYDKYSKEPHNEPKEENPLNQNKN